MQALVRGAPIFWMFIAGAIAACGSRAAKAPAVAADQACSASSPLPDGVLVFRLGDPAALEQARKLTESLQSSSAAPSDVREANRLAMSALGQYVVEDHAAIDRAKAARDHATALSAELTAFKKLLPMSGASGAGAPLVEQFGDADALAKVAAAVGTTAEASGAWVTLQGSESDLEKASSAAVDAGSTGRPPPDLGTSVHAAAETFASAAERKGSPSLAAAARLYAACELVRARASIVLRLDGGLRGESSPVARSFPLHLDAGDRELVFCLDDKNVANAGDARTQALSGLDERVGQLCEGLKRVLNLSPDPGPRAPTMSDLDAVLASAQRVLGS